MTEAGEYLNSTSPLNHSSDAVVMSDDEEPRRHRRHLTPQDPNDPLQSYEKKRHPWGENAASSSSSITPAPAQYTRLGNPVQDQTSINNDKSSKGPPPSSPQPPLSTSSSTSPPKSGDDDSPFECNVCLDMPKDPIVTYCGHIFCWSCLAMWMASSNGMLWMSRNRPIILLILLIANAQYCPVCKSGIDKSRCIPVYARGNENQNDPRNSIPPRPGPQRTDPPPRRQTGGFQFQAGFGIFPGAFFTFNNAGLGNRGGNGTPLTRDQEVQAFVARMFLMIGGLVLLAIIFY